MGFWEREGKGWLLEVGCFCEAWEKGGGREIMETLVNDALHVSGVAKERVQVVGKAAPRIASKSLYVLYWMTGSFRSKQNESLEVAKAVANRMDLPLLVVVTIDAEHYRQGSLRHVTFLLEGTCWSGICHNFGSQKVPLSVILARRGACKKLNGYLHPRRFQFPLYV